MGRRKIKKADIIPRVRFLKRKIELLDQERESITDKVMFLRSKLDEFDEREGENGRDK